MNTVSVILNRDSGTLRTTDMDAFERRLVNALAAMRLIVDIMRGEFASNDDVRTDTCK